MRHITEREYQIGGISCIDRKITDDSPSWRYVMWYFIAAEAAGAFLMTGVVLVAIAKRHGWL